MGHRGAGGGHALWPSGKVPCGNCELALQLLVPSAQWSLTSPAPPPHAKPVPSHTGPYHTGSPSPPSISPAVSTQHPPHTGVWGCPPYRAELSTRAGADPGGTLGTMCEWWVCCWHLGCCYTAYRAQDGPTVPTQRDPGQMSTAPSVSL